MSELQLVRVRFHDDTLDACRRTDGEIVVGFRRVCKVMGLGFESQLQKLKTRSWATVTEIVMVAEDGKRRRVTVVDLKTLHGWLVSINEAKVSPEVRDKLIRYQAECVDVLARYFSNEPAEGDSLLACIKTIHRTAGALMEMRQRQLVTEREVAAVRAIAEQADAKAEAAMRRADGNLGYVSVQGY
jgi:hypothetical protein